jgi:hypothetical protein
VTPQWLTRVLRHSGAIDAATKVSSFEASSIGTGQVGANVRYALSYDRAGPDAPATVVCKFSSRDAASQAAGVAVLTYETEVAFYRDLAHTVDISRPHCHFAEIRRSPRSRRSCSRASRHRARRCTATTGSTTCFSPAERVGRLGSGPSDVAYILGSAFAPERRRSCERDLLIRYHRALVEDYDVSGYPFDHCWRDYVRSSYGSLLMAVFASMMVGRTDRGDAMFMAMANRSAQMAADLDAPAVIKGG